ncbi:hypothetical protein SVIO_072010 [Streptomyces violaceusniger]|uniref:Uncharacterized protein n=1 Tax=Streptomyces violaceusniger TaxID=68280 RepID=A0A4D4LDL6_STRVO|nr:hypothetical protein SVIO_072010 [Streptomyces violaceusniger]
MHAGEDNIGSLAGQRESKFDQHLDLPETGIEKRVGERWEAPIPGTYLRGPWSVAMRANELLCEMQTQRPIEAAYDDRGGGVTEQQGMPPGSTK